MEWYDYLAHAVVALFLANSIPHLVSGVTGHPFPSPFASPPGRGLSSPVVNAVWGCINLGIVWGLLELSPIADPWPIADKLIMAAVFVLVAVSLAAAFGRARRTGWGKS